MYEILSRWPFTQLRVGDEKREDGKMSTYTRLRYVTQMHVGVLDAWSEELRAGDADPGLAYRPSRGP